MEECVNDVSTHEHADVMARTSRMSLSFFFYYCFVRTSKLFSFALTVLYRVATDVVSFWISVGLRNYFESKQMNEILDT